MARKRTTGDTDLPPANAGTTPTPQQFVARWKGTTLSERASAQPHFIGLCRLLDVPAPTDDRNRNSDYGFEARTDISASATYAALATPRLAAPANDDYYE